MRRLKSLTSQVEILYDEHFNVYFDPNDLVAITIFISKLRELMMFEGLQVYRLMIGGIYSSQNYNRKRYIKTPYLPRQIIELDMWDRNLKSYVDNVMDDYIRKLNVMLYYTSDTKSDIIKVEIRRVLFTQKGTSLGGMAGRLNQVLTTQYSNARSIVINQCYEELKSQGLEVDKHWVYTYESKVARQSHVHSNGLKANEDGYFVIDGLLTKGPTMFGTPKQDYNCQCTIKLTVHEP